ncbi:MAG: DNA internalization-related competence protein ComEC/Rec2 [Holophagales bacterium]|nr:DNA internalization-related competence protein ComEC/Rec2 [Holophagales bacterium]MYI80744.1 DNA internalization-related competence protein ComEC/Rec2 [Holophagales bacterium]
MVLVAAGPLDWTTALRRAPLLPLAAALSVVLLAEGPGGSRVLELDPERPATVDVAVPVLGAAAWERADHGWTARARVHVIEQSGRRVPGPGRVWLRLGGEQAPPQETRLQVRGYFSRRPAYRNLHVSRPGEWGFNVKSRWLMVAVGRAPGRGSRLLAGLRQWLLRPVDEAEGPGALLARALVFGDARRVPPEWRTGLRRAGLSHLLAVSGLHVGLLLAGFWWIFGALSGRLAWAGAVSILLLYGCLVGPRPSFLRAAVMALLVFLAMALERPPQALNSLCAALILLLALDPDAGGDLGFRLSFLATAGILVLAPRLLTWWRGGPETRSPKPVAVALAATFAAQLATLPITAVEIGLLTPLSPLLNLAFVPLTALVLGFSLVWVALAALASTPVLSAAAGPCARAVQTILDLLSVPFASLAHLPPGLWLAPPVSVDGTAALALATWLGVLASGFRRAIWALALVLVCTPASPEDEPVLAMLDVGQGEAVLLRSGERGPVILVDGGGFRRGNFAEAALLQALAAEGVHRIDLGILSHGDSDHCRGLLELTSYLRIERLWAVPVELRDGCGRALADRLGGRVRGVGRGYADRVGAWDLEVLHPGADRPEGGNSASMVLRACAGGSCVLLTGDLDLMGERELLARSRRRGIPLRSEVLKVAHHGSRTSTGAALLAAVNPSLALVSAGRRNPYGHPSPEVVTRIERRGIRVLRTDLHGRIEVRFRRDGSGGRRPVLRVAAWPRGRAG